MDLSFNLGLSLSGYFPEASYCASLSRSVFICTKGIMLALNEIKYVKILLVCLVHGQCTFSLDIFPEYRSESLSRALLASPDVILTPFSNWCLPVTRECISNTFLFASSGLGAAVTLQFFSWSSCVGQGVPSS